MNLSSNVIILPDNYKPSKNEEYMNSYQLEYFRTKLKRWKQSILESSFETIDHLKQENLNQPDLADKISANDDLRIELRTKDRDRKLIAKIDEAVERINKGCYGFCQESGKPIGIGRLEARPIANLCIEEQEKHEKDEYSHKDE